MTDRLKGCTVVFDRDIRDDDAEPLLAAIRMLKGVARVAPILHTSEDYVVRARVERELIERLLRLIDEIRRGV